MRLVLFLLLAGVTACTPRGHITLTDQSPELGAVHRVYAATTRQASQDVELFGRERSEAVNFGVLDVSVPPLREPGEIEWPRRNGVDPSRHFVTRGERQFAGRDAFVAALRRDLADQPRGSREVAVFVHGFNNTFAEGVYRSAQIMHDFNVSGIAVHFAWPSASSPFGYVYDRDSVTFSRDGLADVLSDLVDAGADKILILAHSMGGFLTMEAIRQVSLSGDARVKRAISGVILMSPDIDVEVFRAQARAIRPLPQPFVIFVSRRDRALALSARLTGQTARLGNLGTPEQVADLDVTLIDVTLFDGGDPLNHFTAGTSPEVIALITRLPDLDRSLQSGRSVQTGLLPGTVLTLQNATEIFLSPLVAIAD